jgi:capsid protein
MRVLAGVRFVAGECFGIYRDSKRLERLGMPVSLDIQLTEPDQVAHPYGQSWIVNGNGDDGIVCDEGGEVVGYKILRAHPGDQRAYLNKTQADDYSADDVIHWFVPERPGQLRGFTPLAPGLPVFAQLRRFTTATLTAAEFAAMIAGVLESDLPMGGIDGSGSPVISQEQYFDTIEMVRGMLLTLPPGTKASQFKAEQPTTNYSMFVGAKLRELGRAINMPYGKIAGDHSSYNYSSGKLDDSPYWADRDIERQGLESKTFNPFFYRWCDFARFALPRLAAYKGKWWSLKHSWTYDARPTADPVKDASADEINLTNASDSLAAIANRDGTTEDALIASRARTQRKFLTAGLTPPAWLVGGAVAPTRQGDGIPQDVGASRD